MSQKYYGPLKSKRQAKQWSDYARSIGQLGLASWIFPHWERVAARPKKANEAFNLLKRLGMK